MKTIRLRNISICLLLLSVVSCASISNFDQHAYVQTTSVKVDAMNVMDLATENYASREIEVKTLQTQLQKIYEYEKNRPKNEITLQLWDKLLDENGHLLGGFLMRWKNEQKMNEIFIVEAKKIVGKAFDQIAGLESKKIKKSEVTK